MPSFHALIIGASSTIAKAAIEQFASNQDCLGVFAISRTLPATREENSKHSSKVHWIECDNSELSISKVIQKIDTYNVDITKVLICNGILHGKAQHNKNMMPEKKLEDITAAQLEQIFHINTVIPMLWLSKLLPVLKGGQATVVAVFSARIGSISDNKTGGWYSYRASKAALNMLIQNSSVEYARRAKNVKLIAFHPGTTDTPLSEPFQRSVPKDKLFTPQYVASQLLNIMGTAQMDNQASFLDWNNKSIEW